MKPHLNLIQMFDTNILNTEYVNIGSDIQNTKIES